MSWSELAYRGLTVRPFDGPKPPRGHAYSRFRAPLRQTLRQLAHELDALGAKDIVVELDVQDRDIRLDGYPRANARIYEPQVALSFESRHGPLRYATGEYDDWEDNLRGIVLSMKALRAVDRYGVSKRGEQYAGWKQLAQSTDPVDLMRTVTQAREFLAQWDGDVRRALMETHPDRGGDTVEFRKVMRAKELVGA